MPEQKTKKQVKKPRKKPDCRRLSLYPMKPEEAIKAVLDIKIHEDTHDPEIVDKVDKEPLL